MNRPREGAPRGIRGVLLAAGGGFGGGEGGKILAGSGRRWSAGGTRVWRAPAQGEEKNFFSRLGKLLPSRGELCIM
ncbi:MAG: hypothetical protein KME26_14975 [Oscillatoria princeps RMCB-10]|nr:hypothetical protein [Oscillatoria princeps RMCB-10]